jgi:phage gp36-like protein
VALYCLIADVQNRLSADGVTYRTDDTPPVSYGDVLDDASRTIDEYLLGRYSDGVLSANGWVKHRCADIAAYLLCERRGNPPPSGIARKYEAAIEKLEKVRLGRLAVPGAPARVTDAPRMSNMRVRLDPFPHSVVERNRSPMRDTPTDYRQTADVLDWWQYQY